LMGKWNEVELTHLRGFNAQASDEHRYFFAKSLLTR
jgi:hypothetical protein